MDEEADLALLDQHLVKTNSLSQRMTGILGQLDSRLSRLDKTIAPLGLQPLARKAANIDSLLLTLSPSSLPSSSSSFSALPSASSSGTRNPNGSSSSSNATARSPAMAMSMTNRTPSSGSSSSHGNATAKGYSLAPALSANGAGGGAHTSGSRLSPIPSAPSTRVASPAPSTSSALGLNPSTAPNSGRGGAGIDESAIISRGPDIVALSEFFGAYDSVVADLEEMSAAMSQGRVGAREQAVRDLGGLVSKGMEGMVSLLRGVMREGTEGRGKRCDVEGMVERGPPSPPIYLPTLPTLSPLTSYLTALLKRLPPGSPTRTYMDPIFAQGLADIAHERGEWIARGMEGLLGSVEEAQAQAGREQERVGTVLRIWEGLLNVMEAETLLYTTLFPSSSSHSSSHPSSHPSSSASALPLPPILPLTLSYPITLATSSLSNILTQIRRSLSSNAGLALELYVAFQGLAPEWEEGVTKCTGMLPSSSSGRYAGSQGPEEMSSDTDLFRSLDTPLRDLRQLCSRSFPEMLVDIRTGASSSSSSGGNLMSTTSAVADITYSTLTYLEQLPKWQKTVEELLGQSRAERSWLMGSKETPSPARSAQEEGGVVNLYVADVLGTLLTHLQSRSENMRKPAGYSFLLNNVSHIRNTTSSFHSDIIGPAAEDMLNQAFRDAKTQFIQPFTSLVSILSPSSSSSASSHTANALSRLPLSHGSSSLSASAAAFWDRLSELERELKEHPLSRLDPEMRERVEREVWEVVSRGWESWERRVAREGKGGVGVEGGKYMRGGTEEVRSRIGAMFR